MKRQYLILTIGVMSVSFAAVFIRQAEAPPLVIATYRLCLASLVVVPVAGARSRRELSGLLKRSILMSVLSGVFLAAHFGLWITSLDYTSVATSVILVTANPLFVAIASYFFFNERFERQTFLGIAVCIIGGVLIGYGNWRIGIDSIIGGLLALSGALAMAGYLLIGRSVRKSMGLLNYAAISYSSAGLLLLLITVAYGYPLFDYTGNTYAMMVLLAVIPQLLGHLSLNWSLRYVSATLVTIAILGEPVGATILAFIILNEAPTVLEIGGGFLILLGIFIAFRKTKIPSWR